MIPSEFWNVKEEIKELEKAAEGTKNQEYIFRFKGVSYVFDDITKSIMELDTRTIKIRALLNKKGGFKYQESVRLLAGVRGETTGKKGSKTVEM